MNRQVKQWGDRGRFGT